MGRVLFLLASFAALGRTETLPAGAICHKVGDTYKNLRVYQFAARQTFEYSARGAMSSREIFFSLAAVKPERIRLTVKDPDRELIVVSDGETTWRYLPKTKQYTKESSAALEDGDETANQPSQDAVDPLTVAQNTLVNRYAGLARYASAATLAREERIKIEGDKVDCYVLQIRLSDRMEELWIDKRRFLVLRHIDTAKAERGGVPIAVKVTLTFKEADISTTPENGLFAFTPPPNAVEAQTLNLPGERINLTGRIAQDFTLKALEGGKVTLSDLRGKVVLLDFWATWCPPCRKELPSIEKLHREFKDKDLVVLGIDDEDSGTVKGFLKKNEYSIPVLLDSRQEVHRMYGARAIPTVIVIGRDGVIKAHYVGGRGEADLLAALKIAGIE